MALDNPGRFETGALDPGALDPGALDPGTLAAVTTVQRVPLQRPVSLRPLYWRACGTVRPNDMGGLSLEPEATVAFDTYFGAVFERPWRLYTRLGALTLSIELQGQATLRIYRRVLGSPAVLLHESFVTGDVRVEASGAVPHHRQAGLLWFELTAGVDPVVLMRAEWGTDRPAADPAQLAVVICTFNREGPLGDVLAAIAEDAGLDEAVARVIVVNQGRAGLRQHPAVAGAAGMLGERLRVVEQGNFGGAGGFGRGMLEALDDPAVSHVCLLDDDVRLEPESLRRMAAFFTFADPSMPVALGGHMLDGIQETTLYEAGATVRPNWVLKPVNHMMDLQQPEHLLRLLDVGPMHYNGWWMFAFDKSLLERMGMPLPCFIRGDDVEFGLRLGAHGVPTVGLPGVAIWHEPFYLKIGGWQLYYETRNALIAAALHMPFSRAHVTAQVVKRLLLHLLTYRYYNAALVVRAAEDFLLGPAVLDQNPAPLHASLTPLRQRWPEGQTRRERVLAAARVDGSPRGTAGFVVALVWAVVRNWVRPSAPGAPPEWILSRDLVWFRMTRAECLAVDTYWDRDLPTYRRDRAAFRTLLPAGLRAAWRLWRAAPALRGGWAAEAPRLTSPAFWRRYLSVSS